MFKVNQFITLKLVDSRTEIYVDDQLFRQCKFLLINISIEDIDSFEDIGSIDDTVEMLDKSLERESDLPSMIPPEAEFWAHCSNLQVWVEKNYDTRLLHSNLAFPLLKKLSEVGDPLAKRVFKEEIAKRFQAGNYITQKFLIKEGYLDYLSKEMILSLIPESDLIVELERIIKKDMKIRTRDNIIGTSYILKNNKISWIILNYINIKEIPVLIKNIESLIGLSLCGNSLKKLPNWLSDFEELEYLDVSNNQLRELPESITKLEKLKHLNIGCNQIVKLPNSIGNFVNLETLSMTNNRIGHLPDSFKELKSLENFVVAKNSLKSIPESIGTLPSLVRLNLSENPIKKLPHSIEYLKRLKSLFLIDTKIEVNQLIKTLRRKGIDVYIEK